MDNVYVKLINTTRILPLQELAKNVIITVVNVQEFLHIVQGVETVLLYQELHVYVQAQENILMVLEFVRYAQKAAQHVRKFQG